LDIFGKRRFSGEQLHTNLRAALGCLFPWGSLSPAGQGLDRLHQQGSRPLSRRSDHRGWDRASLRSLPTTTTGLTRFAVYSGGCAASILVYGMGESPIREVPLRLEKGNILRRSGCCRNDGIGGELENETEPLKGSLVSLAILRFPKIRENMPSLCIALWGTDPFCAARSSSLILRPSSSRTVPRALDRRGAGRHL